MISASIIAVGSELMRGKMDDTNSTFLARWFESNGIKVINRINVEDTVEAIRKGVELCSNADIIISTGGLGPTDDDVTRDGFAAYLAVDLVFNEDSWQDIIKLFVNRNYPMALSNKRQAFMFKNGHMIRNENGTAPGLYYKSGNKIFILLPGPPHENKPMVYDSVYPLLNVSGFIKGSINSKVFRLYDGGESTIADLFSTVKNEYFDEIGYYFSNEGYVELHFRKYSLFNIVDSKEFIEAYNVYLHLLQINSIYYTENKSISEIVFNKLFQRKMTISFAESCTGGAVSAELVKNAGVSAVFNGGINSYSNHVKSHVLGVDSKTLETYGAVSEETVREMAINASKLFESDISVAVSGIAGPDGGSDEKPVGLVWFAYYVNGTVITEKEVFHGDRIRIIQRSTTRVFKKLSQLI